MRQTFLSTCAFVLVSSVAIADTGLYEGVVDPNSSFVRVVTQDQTIATIGGENIRDIDSGISGYVNVMPGEIDVVLPTASEVIEVGPSSFYTVVFDADGEAEVFTDDITNSPSKADVSFYNLTDTADISVYVPQADAVALEAVGAMQGQSVAINAPLTLDFELRAGDETLSSVSGVDLVRGAGVSIVLLESDQGYAAFATANSYLK
ncbi:alginate O-acetyltransferase AlgF [Yoonia sp. BS5-3]|uniref:Alginate biosynthesis protein AlgF n=1 Tax=Yoonia phaeophyticola TaxID=3137369 RepID=A0ABZ2VAP4_9RHOB